MSLGLEEGFESHRYRLILSLLIAVAVLLRLGVVFLSPPTAESVLTPLNDSTDYHVLAVSLTDGNGWTGPSGQPSAFRPPLYPVFLALTYLIFGTGNLLAVAIIQALIGGLSVWLISACARAFQGSALAALFAALAYTLYPAFLLQVSQILTEELGRALLLGAAFLLATSWQKDQPARWLIGAGVLLGLAVLNKSVLAATLPFVGLLAGVPTWRNPRQFLQRCIVFTVPVAILLCSWTIRNAAVSGHFIPVSTNFPITFSQGITRHSLYTQQWYGDQLTLLEAPDDFLELTQLRNYSGIEEEIKIGNEWQEKARTWISENPSTFTVLTVRKALHYWGPFIRNSKPVQAIALLTMGPVILLGWLGILTALRTPGQRRKSALLALAIGLPCTLPYAISQCDVRYRLALSEPFWMIFAALVAADLCQRLFSEKV